MRLPRLPDGFLVLLSPVPLIIQLIKVELVPLVQLRGAEQPGLGVLPLGAAFQLLPKHWDWVILIDLMQEELLKFANANRQFVFSQKVFFSPNYSSGRHQVRDPPRSFLLAAQLRLL